MSKIYKTTIVEELPQEGSPDLLYLVFDEDINAFIAYTWTGSQYIQIGEPAGSSVEWDQQQASGQKIAEITIDGTATDIYIPDDVATTTDKGLMSAADKTKLDEIGTVQNYSENAVSVPTGNTPTLVQVIRVPEGKWLVITTVYFSGNSGGGWRYTFWSNTHGSSPSPISRLYEDNGANVGATTYDSRIVGVLEGQGPMAYIYLYAEQNSGVSLNTRTNMQMIKIG